MSARIMSEVCHAAIEVIQALGFRVPRITLRLWRMWLVAKIESQGFILPDVVRDSKLLVLVMHADIARLVSKGSDGCRGYGREYLPTCPECNGGEVPCGLRSFCRQMTEMQKEFMWEGNT